MTSGALVRDKIQRFIASAGLLTRMLENGWQIPYESTAVNIEIIEQEDRTLVHLYVPLLHSLAPSPALFEWIATKGQDYFFGACHYVTMDDGMGLLTMEQTLLGDYLDEEEFMSALGALATSGNDLDDELQGMFGGKKFSEPSS